jgi:hypothetical protein
MDSAEASVLVLIHFGGLKLVFPRRQRQGRAEQSVSVSESQMSDCLTNRQLKSHS